MKRSPWWGPASLLACVPALLVTFAEDRARADATGPGDKGDKAMAEALFRAAKDLQASGKLAEACPKFAESHHLDPKPGTILNLATCHEQEGKTATAWADYTEAATFANRAKQADREKFARAKVVELEKELSYVVIHLDAAADKTPSLEVSVDGKTISTAAATGTRTGTRIPVDPGEHTVEAHAPGRVAWSMRVDIPRGPVEKAVAVPALAVEGPPVAPTPPPPARAHANANAHASGGGGQRALGWVGVGVGAAGLAVGSLFGVRTLSEKSTVDEHCTGSACDQEGLDANDRARSNATISTVGFVAGGAILVAGIVLLLTAPSGTTGAPAATLPQIRRPAKPSGAARLRVGPRGLGVVAMW